MTVNVATDATDLVVIVPVLMRAHRVRPFLESLHAGTVEPHRVVFVATRGDRAMIAACQAAALADPTVRVETIAPNRVGDYARKINHGFNVTTEPFLFCGADDLHFHPGWYTAARAAMRPNRIGVVGTQDLSPTQRAREGSHATHSLVRRSYVERFGTIDEVGKVLHEGYPHEFVDDEFIATAKQRHAFAFAHDSVVEHLHPSWHKAPSDIMYRQAKQRMALGRIVYERRQKLWM